MDPDPKSFVFRHRDRSRAMCQTLKLSDSRGDDVDRNLFDFLDQRRHFVTTDDPSTATMPPASNAKSPGGKRDYDYLFKLVLIGDSGVGKSCLLLRFAVSSIFLRYRAFCLAKNKKMTRGTDGEPRRWNRIQAGSSQGNDPSRIEVVGVVMIHGSACYDGAVKAQSEWHVCGKRESTLVVLFSSVPT